MNSIFKVMSRDELEALRDQEIIFKAWAWGIFEELWKKAQEDPSWEILGLELRTMKFAEEWEMVKEGLKQLELESQLGNPRA